MRAHFITFEGIDGAGKSTHIPAIQAYLHHQGLPTYLTREPGGTELGEVLRELLLNRSMTPATEALLAFAARQEHLTQVIQPRLAAGTWVLSDRFSEASYAYQGAGRGLGFEAIATLEQWTQGDFRPDLTFLFDIDPAQAQARISARILAQAELFDLNDETRDEKYQARARDQFEQQDSAFFNRVRQAYLQHAARFPNRFCVLDASQSQPHIKQQIERRLADFIAAAT